MLDVGPKAAIPPHQPRAQRPGFLFAALSQALRGNQEVPHPTASHSRFHNVSVLDALLGLGLLMLSLTPFLSDLQPHDAQRIVWAILMAGLGIWGGFIRFRPTVAEGSVLLAFLAFGVISSIHASSPRDGWIETLSWMAILTGSMILSRSPLTPERWARYLGLFALISSLYILYFIVGYLAAAVEHLPLVRDSLIVGFSNIRFHSQLQTWTLPLLMAGAVLATNRRAYALWMLVATLSWGLLFVSGTRGTLLGLAVSAAVVAWLFREHARDYLITLLLSAAGGALLFMLVVFLLPATLGLDNADLIANTVERDVTSSSGRTQLWLHSLGMAMNHPWLGAGPMHFACDNPLNNGAHPHNVWLQFLGEWGIPFTLAATVGLSYLVIRWVTKIQGTSTEHRSLALPLTASLSAALAHSLFDGIAVMPLSQFYGVLLSAWALSWYRGAEQTQPAPTPLEAIPLALPGLILLGYVAFSLTGLSARQEAELLQGPGHLQPRFWSQGMICLHPLLTPEEQGKSHTE